MQESDIVMCTVERIDGTTVFVRIDGTNEQGTIITSEIAPGRIRNLRDYVSPGRKIVCKILRIGENNVYLSLRRVTPKEKKEVMEKYDKERNSLGILRSVLGQDAPSIAEKIKQSSSLSEFLSNCRNNPKALEQYMPKDQAAKLCKILSEKKERSVEVKHEFSLSSKKPDGISQTKQVLEFCRGDCSISYIAAGKFTVKIKAHDFKKANQEISKALESIEKQAKEKKMDFQIKEK